MSAAKVGGGTLARYWGGGSSVRLGGGTGNIGGGTERFGSWTGGSPNDAAGGGFTGAIGWMSSRSMPSSFKSMSSSDRDPGRSGPCCVALVTMPSFRGCFRGTAWALGVVCAATDV